MKDSQNVSVSEQLRGELAAHLNQCAACRATLEQLSGDHEAGPVALPHCYESALGAAATVHTLAEFGSAANGDEEGGIGLRPATILESLVASEKRVGPHQFPEAPRDKESLGAVGRYQVKEVIAYGGMATLYRAEDDTTGQMIALKIMHSWLDNEDAARQRIEREVESAKRVNHPNVVAVYDLLLRDDLPPSVVMELLSGKTLQHVLGREELLPPRDAAFLISGAADGLAACHAEGIVHRDVKPSNLLVEQIAGESRLVLSDFGIARDCTQEENLTQAGGLLGTPAYMSPEQIRNAGDVDPRSDVYSLGCVLYEMLTGRPPFLGSVRMLLWQATHDIPRSPKELNEGVDRALETICLKAISSAPKHRYHSATEFANDLNRYLEGRPIHASPAGVVRRFTRKCQLYPIFTTVTASAFLLLTAITTISLIATNRMAEARKRESKAMTAVVANQRIAQAQSELQRKAAALAREQSLLAFDTLIQAVGDIQGGMDGLPVGSPIRRRLQQSSMKNLTVIANSLTERSPVDLKSAESMYNLGQLVSILNSKDSGKPDDEGSVDASNRNIEIADSLFERAYEITALVIDEGKDQRTAKLLASNIKAKHGTQLIARSELDRARDAYEISLRLMRDVTQTHVADGSESRFMVRVLNQLARIHIREKKLEKAAEYLEESLATARRYFPKGPPTVNDREFESCQLMMLQHTLSAQLAKQMGDSEKELEHWTAGAELSSELAETFGELNIRTLEAALVRIGCTAAMLNIGESQRALDHAEKAVGILMDFLEADPTDQQARYWLSWVYGQQARAYRKLGNKQKAAEFKAKVAALSKPDRESEEAVEK